LLQLLVGVVDAELLEAVLLEVLEAVDVLCAVNVGVSCCSSRRRARSKRRGGATHEDADKVLDRALDLVVGEALVDDADEPVEQRRVDVLGDRVLDDVGLRRVEARHDLVGAGHDLLLEDPLLELGLVDAEELGRHREALVVVVEERVGPGRADLHVAEVEQGREDLEDVPLALDGDADRRQGLLRDGELVCVVDAGDLRGAALVEEREGRRRVEAERLALRRWRTGEELVEDVVVALRLGLVHEAGPLEEVGADAGADDRLRAVEQDLRGSERSSARSSRRIREK